MDFQENRQTEVSTDNAQSVENVENNNTPSGQNGQPYENSSLSPCQSGQSYGNNSGSPAQNGQPCNNGSGTPYQGRPPYGNGTPYPAPQQPYGNNDHANVSGPNGNPYRNNMPYGNQYPNGNGYHPNANNYNPNSYNPNSYNPNNGYHNQYPYYGRNAYQIPVAEPGSNLAKAAMICGILSIIFCLTFTVYPAFVLGSVAVILALLSKGRRNKLFSQARTGIICAVIGLVMNAVILTSSLAYVFTNPEGREEFNRQWERIYGEPFDDMMKDMLENENRMENDDMIEDHDYRG